MAITSNEFEIMQTDFPIGIAKGLDQSDLLTLGLYHAGNDDIEQEGRNREE